MSDSSDDDDLLSFTPFKGANKRQRTASTSPPPPSHQKSSENDTSAINKSEAELETDQIDETQAEARRKVNTSFVPTRVESPSMLYWHKISNKKKKVNWYPCRECHQDEVIGLKLPQTWDNEEKALIQYIEGTSFGSRTLVARKSLFLYNGNEIKTDDTDTPGNGNLDSDETEAPCWCPTKLKETSKRNRKRRTKEFCNEACVRAMELYMEKVLDTSIERMKELREKREAKVKEEIKEQQEWQLSQNLLKEDNGGDGQSPFPLDSAIISQSQEDNDDYSSSDDFNTLSKHTRKKLLLRPGDIIGYYEPNQTFGDAKYLRRGEVEEIDCRKEMVLRVSGGVYFDKEAKVKLIKRIMRGKYEDFNGVWMHVEDYKLISATTKKKVSGMKARALELKKVIDEKKKEAVENMKTEGLGKFTDFVR